MDIPFARFFRKKQTPVQAKTQTVIQDQSKAEDEAGLLRRVKSWGTSTSADEVARALGDLGKMTRMYAAGMVDEYNADFIPTYGAPNTEILPSIYSVRARMRTLMKDTPQGRAIKRSYMSNVVGPNPFKLDMRYGTWEVSDGKQLDGTTKKQRSFRINDETNNAVEEFWEWFGKAQNLHTRKLYCWLEANLIVEGETVEAGGVVCRLYNGYPYNEIKFAVDFLETDRLQEQFCGFSGADGKFGAGNPIRGSIEYDKQWGFPVAYWLLTRHPGEFFAQTPTWDEDRAKNFRIQVPASQIIYVSNIRDRAEQDIGMCEAASAVQTIWRNQQFDKALTLCAIACHIRAFVLEKDSPTGMEMPAEIKELVTNFMANYPGGPQNIGGSNADVNNPVETQQDVGTKAVTDRPGQWTTYPPGTKAKIIGSEFPTAESHMFREDNARLGASGAGVSYTDYTGDFQNMGFIAGLMSQVPSHRWYTIRQNHRKENWIEPLFRAALKAAITTGWFDRRGYGFISITKLDDYLQAAKFKGQKWPFVNPLIEIQTLILAMEAGFKSPQQVQDELPDGIAIEDLYKMYSEANQEAENNGLDFSSGDVTRPQISKGEPGQKVPNPNSPTEGGAQPPPKSKTPNPLRNGHSGHRPVFDENGDMIDAGIR